MAVGSVTQKCDAVVGGRPERTDRRDGSGICPAPKMSDLNNREENMPHQTNSFGRCRHRVDGRRDVTTAPAVAADGTVEVVTHAGAAAVPARTRG